MFQFHFGRWAGFVSVGHSQELLNTIATQMYGQYPRADYRYEFEKPLYLSDRRNQPDNQSCLAFGLDLGAES